MRGAGPSTPLKELSAKAAHKETTATRLHTAPAQPADDLPSNYTAPLLPGPLIPATTPPAQHLSQEDSNSALPQPKQPTSSTPNNNRLSPGLSFTQKMRMKKANG
jgi:hypothetical protein